MTENERKEAEMRSIMRLVSGEEPKEAKSAPKKTAKKTAKGAKK